MYLWDLSLLFRSRVILDDLIVEDCSVLGSSKDFPSHTNVTCFWSLLSFRVDSVTTSVHLDMITASGRARPYRRSGSFAEMKFSEKKEDKYKDDLLLSHETVIGTHAQQAFVSVYGKVWLIIIMSVWTVSHQTEVSPSYHVGRDLQRVSVCADVQGFPQEENRSCSGTWSFARQLSKVLRETRHGSGPCRRPDDKSVRWAFKSIHKYTVVRWRRSVSFCQSVTWFDVSVDDSSVVNTDK